MSEVTTGEIDAARRWAQSVASVSPYQRIISLCNALDARDATITALREQVAGLTAALRDAAKYLWETGDNNALARRFSVLAANPAPTPAREAQRTPIFTYDREQLGRAVRDVWLEHQRAKDQPKPQNLLSWEELDEGAKEIEMKMGERLFIAGWQAALGVVLTPATEV
jgi:hypothetical protein